MEEPKQLNVNLAQLVNERCACGNDYWEKINILKKVPGLMIGQAQATIMPVEMYRCDKCKTLHPDFTELLKKINGEAIKKMNG